MQTVHTKSPVQCKI